MSRNPKPPPLALWILSRLLRGARRDALIGDLCEEYQHGRTRLWYWRQALCAVAADVREHPPRRTGLDALRLLLIASVIAGSGLWPLLFVLPLDPGFWWLLRRHKDRRDRARSRGHAP